MADTGDGAVNGCVCGENPMAFCSVEFEAAFQPESRRHMKPPRFTRRFAKCVLLAIFVPNATFFAAHYAARCLPVEIIRSRIALALMRGDILTDTSKFVFLDSTRGVEPWGDANTLRMAIYRGPSKWKDSLAPRLLAPVDGIVRHPAQELQGAIDNNLRFDPNSGYYHRYWHGNVVVTAFLLMAGDLRQVRLWLMTTSYFLFMVLPLAACLHSPRFGILMGIISGFGVWFSSLPYHGQTLAYAPAFIWSQAIVLPALWFCRVRRPPSNVVPLGLITGAVAAFLEPMSGSCLLGGGMLFLTLYFGRREAGRGRAEFFEALAGFGAFLLGLVTSIGFKQATVALVFGWDQTFGVFLGQLKWRMGVTGEHVSVPKLVEAVGASLVYLTFGSPALAKLLVGATGLATATAAVITALDLRRCRPNPRTYDYATLAAATIPIAGWYFVLPSHNFIHAWITVRLLYLPFALCWVWLWISIRPAALYPLDRAHAEKSFQGATERGR